MKKEIINFCKRFNITLNQFFGKEEIGGDLWLNGNQLTSLTEGFNPTVGGSLCLNGNQLTSLPEGFNPTVGGSLCLNGERRYIGKKVNIKKMHFPEIYTWQNGRYIKADGIFMEVISKKGNVYKVRKINKTEESFLITDGDRKWSHGNTLKEAKKDLIYKIGSRNKDEYKNLTIDSELSFEKSIELYRVITGACSFGTRNFVESKLISKKDKYKISEIIELTNGEWGNSVFKDFFNK